jgi:hypothetical protein
MESISLIDGFHATWATRQCINQLLSVEFVGEPTIHKIKLGFVRAGR